MARSSGAGRGTYFLSQGANLNASLKRKPSVLEGFLLFSSFKELKAVTRGTASPGGLDDSQAVLFNAQL